MGIGEQRKVRFEKKRLGLGGTRKGASGGVGGSTWGLSFKLIEYIAVQAWSDALLSTSGGTQGGSIKKSCDGECTSPCRFPHAQKKKRPTRGAREKWIGPKGREHPLGREISPHTDAEKSKGRGTPATLLCANQRKRRQDGWREQSRPPTGEGTSEIEQGALRLDGHQQTAEGG